MYSLTSDGEHLDHPCIQLFATKEEALKLLVEMWEDWKITNDIEAETMPEPETFWQGEYYRFDDFGNSEWFYLVEHEVL